MASFLQIGGRVHRALLHAGIPAVDQTATDVEHRTVVVAQTGIAESRHQDVMGLLPVRLTVEGGEQAVACQRANPGQRRRQVLGEPAFIAELVDQFP
jgi:hypothetical protein